MSPGKARAVTARVSMSWNDLTVGAECGGSEWKPQVLQGIPSWAGFSTFSLTAVEAAVF